MTESLPFKPGRFIPWLLSREDVRSAWTQHTEHPFVLALGSGTLPMDAFKKYLIQDYHFLTHYVRIMCLLAAKIPEAADIFIGAQGVAQIVEEAKLHVKYCEEFGLNIDDILAIEEHPALTTYVKFLRDVATHEDCPSLFIAMSPCSLGYKIVGQSLATSDKTKRVMNPYWPWIEQYSGDEYARGVEEGLALLEKYIAREPADRIESFVTLFIRAVELECDFWSMGLSK